MRKKLLFFFIATSIIASYGTVLVQRVKAVPDVNTNVWDFSNSIRERKNLCIEYHLAFMEEGHDFVWEEDFRDSFTLYCQKGDTCFLRTFEMNNLRVKPLNAVYMIKGASVNQPYVAIDDSIRLQGEYSWNPGVDGTMVFSETFSIPASMSTERIDLVMRKAPDADRTISDSEADTLPHYTISTYRWTVEGRKWPVATMRVIEEKDNKGQVLNTSTTAFCAKEEWVSGVWKTMPNDIDVIPSKDGFTFLLPGGCEPSKVDVVVTTENGTELGKAHYNMKPGESHLMKLSNLSVGLPYYAYITVKGDTYKRTIRIKK